MSVWIILAFLLFGLGITFGTRWLASRLWQGTRRHLWWTTILADLTWVAIVTATAILAGRYIERLGAPALGYTILVLSAGGVSLLRAFLYQRALDQRPERAKPDLRKILQTTLHNSTYLLFALVLYLLISWLTAQAAQPLLFLPLFAGALLPDLDCHDSWIGHLLPFISRRLEARLGACQEWHSLAAIVIVALVLSPLIPIFGLPTWGLIGLGFLAHLLVDLLSVQGIMLLWPASRTRYVVFAGFVDSPGGPAERALAGALSVIALLLLLTVSVGPSSPPIAPPPSYQQSLQKYLSLRGRRLAFADVDGTWQATGRRVTARYEILNATGESLVMLDRYAGWVFTAGQGASDDLYLSRITVLQGAEANIKPVEVSIEDQDLGAVLPTLYQMQPEPGLQHIFVSGDVILSGSDLANPPLKPDYSQTQVRRIVWEGEGHYSLHYLTAADLIPLARVRVATADLIIVATYANPPVGPTATPLPELPPLRGAP